MKRPRPFRIALAAALLAACIDITVDSKEIASIEFVPYPYPSVNAGDTLRDGAGAKALLQANVFRADGTRDDEADVTFLALDTTVTISGAVLTGRALPTGAPSATARVVASIAGIQSSPRTITIVPVPDSFARDVGRQDSLARYSFPPLSTDTFPTLAARVTRRDGSATSGVQGYVVAFTVRKGARILNATDTTGTWFLTDDAGRASAIDTTDTGGLASRRLVFRLRSGGAARDTVEVLADVRRGSRIPTGDPIRWIVRALPRGATP